MAVIIIFHRCALDIHHLSLQEEPWKKTQIKIDHYYDEIGDLGCHAEAQGIVVTVVGHIGHHMETGQQRIRVSEVKMVNPSSSLVSWTCHKLVEAKILECSREETVGMLVQADVQVSRDHCDFLHVD